MSFLELDVLGTNWPGVYYLVEDSYMWWKHKIFVKTSTLANNGDNLRIMGLRKTWRVLHVVETSILGGRTSALVNIWDNLGIVGLEERIGRLSLFGGLSYHVEGHQIFCHKKNINKMPTTSDLGFGSGRKSGTFDNIWRKI